MNKTTIGIYDEHRLFHQGIIAILKEVEDFEVIICEDSLSKLLKKLSAMEVHILIINIHLLTTQVFNLIVQINISNPKTKILIISVHNEEEVVLKTVKAGAKGFLARDSEKNELIEAIYTLRNGHDYYSKSITHLLINKYIANLKSGETEKNDLTLLSSRELEIIKLWGNSLTNKEIADKLFISIRTVESHKNHIMQKLNLRTTVDLVKFAIKNNLVEI